MLGAVNILLNKAYQSKSTFSAPNSLYFALNWILMETNTREIEITIK